MKRVAFLGCLFLVVALVAITFPLALRTAAARPLVAEPISASCQELIINGGAEQNTGWIFPATPATAGYSTAQAHGGSRSIRVGIVGGANGLAYSSAIQYVDIPAAATDATLSLWLYLVSSGTERPTAPTPAMLQAAASNRVPDVPFVDDAQYILLLDEDANTIETLLWTRQNASGWQQYIFDLSEYAGETIGVLVGAYNNGTGGVTGLYLDDTSVAACDGVEPAVYLPLVLRSVAVNPPAEGALLINGQPVYHVVGHPNSAVIYGLTSSGLYRSNNGAATWAFVNASPPATNTLVMAPDQPNTLYGGPGFACFKGGDDVPMWKSTDGGVTWDDLPAGLNLQPLAVHPTDEERVYARACSAPWLSYNGGDSWAQQSDDLFLTHGVVYIAPAAADDWETVYVGTATEGGAGAIIGSGNGGTTWEQQTPLFADIFAIGAVLADPVSTSHVYFGEANAFWGSSTGGSSWYTSTNGLEDVLFDPGGAITQTYGLFSLAYVPNDLNDLLLGTIRGLYGSEDRGHTWAKLNGPAWQNQRVSGLLLRSVEPSKLFITTPGGVYIEYLSNFP